MDVSVLATTNFFCRLSSRLRPHSTTSPYCQFTNNPLKKHTILFLKTPSWNPSAVPRTTRRAFRISAAQFRRPPRRRRNTLREKLVVVNGEDQVRQIPQLLKYPDDSNSEDLSYSRDEIENVQSSLDLDNKELDETVGSEKLNSFSGNSVLWDKLENWVDQYKVDSEFWGIGTNPIFTIYQDSDKNVVRVSVNEDEIAKRSRVRAWSFEQKEEIEKPTDVNSKISRAKLIAKEIEAGEYTLPRNSSVAKFVVEGKKSSFVDGLRSVSLWHEPFLKAFPRIGFTVLCAFCVFSVTKKLFVGNEKVELKRKDAEMLRRKKKSRMEREKSEKGSVKVLQNVEELPMISGTRPQLDRNDLMKSIKEAKTSRESLVVSDSSSHFSATNLDFDNKVREIREMARKVRELERQDCGDKKGGADNLSSIVLASKGRNDTIGSKAYVESKSAKIGSDRDSISEINYLVDNKRNIELSMDVENKKMLGGNIEGCISDIPDVESSRSFGTNGDTVTINVDDHETDATRYLREIPIGVDAENTALDGNSNTLIVDSLRNEEVEQNKMESINMAKKESGNISSGTCSSAGNKPKIIRSVKEAREYLAEKRGISNDKVQSKQEVQLKRPATGVNACDRPYDEKHNDKIRQTVNENIKVVDPSKVSKSQTYGDIDAVSLLKGSHVNDVYEAKSHEDDAENSKSPIKIEGNKVLGENNVDLRHDIPNGESEKPLIVNIVKHALVLDDSETDKTVYSSEILLTGDAENTDSKTFKIKNLNGERRTIENQTGRDSCTYYASGNKQALESQGSTYDNSSSSSGSSVLDTPGMVENGAYNFQEFNSLSIKGHLHSKAEVGKFQDGIGVCNVTSNEPNVNNGWSVIAESKMVESPDLTLSAVNSSEESTSKKDRFDADASPLFPGGAGISGGLEPLTLNAALDDSDDKHDVKGLPRSETSFQLDSDGSESDRHSELLPLKVDKSWVEENFEQFDPIIKKIGAGFKQNYMVAKEKVQEQSGISAEISELGLLGEDEELEWMKDEKLQEIVFQVRENELAGRDPFHLMDADDQRAFFKGLERKTEKVNAKLSGLHEWVHSRIENLDYGADGISLDDPLEKIVPRWKGPAIDKDPEFLNKFTKHPMANSAGNMGHSHVIQGETQNSLQKSDELPNSNGVSPYSPVISRTPHGASANPKTLIECSDGSSKPGNKKGKEHWQHTKKWSRGFLEVYNAETDPEIKSIMKDMGKDLDRWITEKETQDVADLMTRIPKRKRRYIEKKMDKLKREVEMYGAQAVVSKYREYSDEKDEDYLWWLDHQFVLCIELYTMEDGVQKVGFYSLEMAAELELNPKQYHVIAFEDPGDSKNFCYIIQAHMDMLGSGRAFVVARPPKDAFREAKANGFSVTVIKKGEVRLNVDQTLEEVEEEITEIGSKIYHDKIMHERAVDIRTLMKGVVSADKSTKRRSKQLLTKPRKSRR